MNNATIGAAVLGGYLLGRTKKAKLALGLGALLAGSQVRPGQLGKAVDAPFLGDLTKQIRSELTDASKAAATSVLSSKADSLAGTLHERTAGLRGRAEENDEEDEPDDDTTDDTDTDTEDEDEDEARDDGKGGGKGGEGSARRSGGRSTARRGGSAPKSAPQSKTTARPKKKTAATSRAKSGSSSGGSRSGSRTGSGSGSGTRSRRQDDG
ncbi:ABC transporter substrate-binding protein [Streptomyces brasiliscabiei]|uniref:ABC transporter substrate-binding protein n=1 Tax=Streptomyces brasiliscabiei TaxID=2736302 RepID=A0ABU8GR19_9ACTN